MLFEEKSDIRKYFNQALSYSIQSNVQNVCERVSFQNWNIGLRKS